MPRIPVHTPDNAPQGSQVELKALEATFGKVLNIPKLDALLALAREYTSNVGSVQDATWRTAAHAGWTDEQLTELSVHVTLNLFTNYFNHFVETDLDLTEAPAL